MLNRLFGIFREMIMNKRILGLVCLVLSTAPVLAGSFIYSGSTYDTLNDALAAMKSAHRDDAYEPRVESLAEYDARLNPQTGNIEHLFNSSFGVQI